MGIELGALVIPGVAARSRVDPPPTPVPVVTAAIVPAARKAWGRYGGSASGAALAYTDLHSFAWWLGGGWLTVNRGHRGIQRTHRGAEDVVQIQR